MSDESSREPDQPVVPAPRSKPPFEPSTTAEARPERGRAHSILSTDECLEKLGGIPGLIALRMLSPAQANAMRASYHEILAHHQKTKASSAGPALSNADVASLGQMSPEVLKALEPFLTDEQIDQLLRPGK